MPAADLRSRSHAQNRRRPRTASPSAQETRQSDADRLVGGETREKIALRRAIAMAFDDNEYMPPGIDGYLSGYQSSNMYDPAIANAVLDRVGYKRGPDGYGRGPVLLQAVGANVHRTGYGGAIWSPYAFVMWSRAFMSPHARLSCRRRPSAPSIRDHRTNAGCGRCLDRGRSPEAGVVPLSEPHVGVASPFDSTVFPSSTGRRTEAETGRTTLWRRVVTAIAGGIVPR